MKDGELVVAEAIVRGQTDPRPPLTDRTREETTGGQKPDFVVPVGVHTIQIYACGGGLGGSNGQSSQEYSTPGAGGHGGAGSPPQYWEDKTGNRDIPVNPGDVFSIEIGKGGLPGGAAGGQTIVRQKLTGGAPAREFKFGWETATKFTSGGVQAARGRDGSKAGQSSPLARGGAGWIRLGHQDNHWGGGGGGGGAGLGRGGNGGAGGCDGGSEVAFPGGTASPDFKRAHSGADGEDGQGNGAGGGGGGGAGDRDRDGGYGQGGQGGKGGDGYLVIVW